MAFITWTQDIAVNEEIDNQHKNLFDILNKLHESVTAGAEQGALAKILISLIDYTVEHFETEEKYFAKYSYPDTEAHKKEHVDLTQKAIDLQQQFKDGNLTISFDLLDFLYDWLTTHTSESDKKFSEFLKTI
ncbi:hemerythrin family protein [Candidatus Dependentiae bacterium]|nr:hemerythrin family protein [Candidatus Dependentiae bacterium]